MKRNFNITILLAISTVALSGVLPVSATAKQSRNPESVIGLNDSSRTIKSCSNEKDFFAENIAALENNKPSIKDSGISDFAKKRGAAV